MADVQKILADLIAFDTTSRNSNAALIDYIRGYLERFGVASEIVASADNAKFSLWATIGGEAPAGIVLAGHTDTVPVDGQAWSSDPFRLIERDGKLFGRGSCDMKGFIACVLALVPELVGAWRDGATSLPRPVHLAFTHDEETTMAGAENLARFLSEKKIRPEWVWIGEPTLHKVIDSHKGVAAFETKITGVPAHSGKPDMGLSAIELGHDFIAILRRVAEEKRMNPFPASRFDPAYTTINLGLVEGGTAENIVAERWRLVWQTRQHPGDDHDAMLADIDRTAAKNLAARFQAFEVTHPEIGCKTCVICNIPPLMPTPQNPGHKILTQLTGNLKTESVSFGTEAGFFQRLGCGVVVCGPGSIDQAHKADEYVEVRELSKCVDLLRSVLLPSKRP